MTGQSFRLTGVDRDSDPGDSAESDLKAVYGGRKAIASGVCMDRVFRSRMPDPMCCTTARHMASNMDTNDRQAITALFDKIADVERRLPARDAEAEDYINAAIARQPCAPY